MQKYELIYKNVPDWKLTLPVFIVDSFFLNKGIKNVEYNHTAFGAFSVTKVPNCSVALIPDNKIVTHYKQIAEICKVTD